MRGNTDRYLSETMVRKAASITASSQTYKCLNNKTLKINVPDIRESIERLKKKQKSCIISTAIEFVCILAGSIITLIFLNSNRYELPNPMMLVGFILNVIGMTAIAIDYYRHRKYEILDDSINKLWFMMSFANSKGEIIVKFDEIHNEVALNFVDKYEANRHEIKLAYTTIPDAINNPDTDILIELTQDKVNNSNIIVYKKAS